MTSSKSSEVSDAWHPGLSSTIPDRLYPLSTMFVSDNSCVSYSEAKDLSEFCGIPGKPQKFVCFKVERLIQHEVMVRVMGDLSVPDGPNYEELGINLREMISRIYENHIVPELDSIRSDFTDLRSSIESFVASEIDSRIYNRGIEKSSEQPKSFFGRLFSKKQRKEEDVSSLSITESPESLAIRFWGEQFDYIEEMFPVCCYEGLAYMVGLIVGSRGRLVTDRDLTIRLVTNHIINDYGGNWWVRDRISDLFESAANSEGYRFLPGQAHPVILNVKGASASGKSTIRPQQRELVTSRLDLRWEDFALISPDYWRKYMLDYGSLGSDHKYAGMLTGHELEIVDSKLDRLMSGKALGKRMPHLLIDRFRFDSFAVEHSADSRLLTRFGDRIFLFFMVTPPSETVERAWERGKKTGRYKAVDDLLYHNIEAYTGMPNLFFSWAVSNEKDVRFEFLDNDVPYGELPRTAAFGCNNRLIILDVDCMLNIDRYKRVDVEARSPSSVFGDNSLSASDNMDFLLRCIQTVDEVIFLDSSNNYVYAASRDGELVWCDHKHIRGSENPDFVEVFGRLGFDSLPERSRPPSEHSFFVDIATEKKFTFGRWGIES